MISLFLVLFSQNTFANIDISVSPIKYELEYNPGESVNKIIKVFNNTDFTQDLFITTKNAFSMNTWWQPLFVESIKNPELFLADWIKPSTTDFQINPWEIKDIPITIDIPSNAAPWWHYAAVFFNIKELENWQINLKKRIWVIIMLKIPWELTASWQIDNITITSSSPISTWWINYISDNKDILDIIFHDTENNSWSIINSVLSSWSSIPNNNKFNVNFSIDFSNKWNIHIKPTWKIEIVDDKGNKLKNVWKITIKDENWVVTWEKLVDYVPINDEWWYILPNTNRIYDQNWEWFWYEDIDENWNKIIRFKDPSENDAEKNQNTNLFPWENMCRKKTTKTYKAILDLSYADPSWKDIKFDLIKDFDITYYENCKSIKLYYVIFWSQLILILFILFLLLLFRRKKCPNCNKKIKKDMKICPYCWYDLRKKKAFKTLKVKK